ncbi:ChrR family anti-sigma-E factor [Henriciella aquimarina]|uniref:ChrR family anti-sigma-E factor n=1 Tax=Henriciella aquimarina TaxID=545261 RepID=UPI001301D42F|nr:ChrR family anti-sigma-E factor [Henriciella aquimarina]
MPQIDPSYVSELYSAYAAGRLSPAFALLVETQAALRTDIRNDIAHAEAIAGALLERETGEAMSPRAFESVLHAIDALEDSEDVAVQIGETDLADDEELRGLPEPVRTRALKAFGQSGWRRLTGGVSRIDLSENTAVHAHLYRIRPGASVPAHSHKGDELTLVLTGGFSDHTGSYGPGDISCQSPGDTHHPVADDDGVCIALAVSEGGLKFTGILGLIQKFAGQ